MKIINRIHLLILAIAILPFSLQANIQADSTGLPGDHFSLEGALSLFKKATSPEDFEKLLNTENENVNNLDLNEDGEVDYIRVVDYVEGDVHAIVLQVPVSEKESQDIAVIEIEKTGEETAMLQIIGDEDLYPDNTIVEPHDVEAEQGGKGGPSVNFETRAIIVNVWAWPSVRFVYRPAYVAWSSPWYWAAYPRWWKPWRPRPWRVHYNRCVVYRPHYRVVTTHRVVRAHRVYKPRRKSSVVVHTRTTTIKRSQPKVKTTKSTTVVKRKNGKTVAGQKKTTVTRTPNGTKKTTTTKAGKKTKNGKVGVKKTTTRKKRH
ncbi:MAG: hypothetical protein MI974_23390 [Chitinophagales bacterium]|nr:hypothetical protein [Chitinophagales bacterium]